MKEVNYLKAKILTWYHYDNYGTLLQAYALQTLISKKFDCAEIINYNPIDKQIKKRSSLILSKKFWVNKKNNFPYFLLEKTKIAKTNRNKAFNDFRDEFLITTKQVKTKAELNNICKDDDIIICGSDQIWNPNNYDSTYFFDFLSHDILKASFSPSFGIKEIHNQYVYNEIRSLLLKFDKISVREESGSKIVKEMINESVPVTLDPTLLISAEHWSKISNGKASKDIKYALVYLLGYNKSYWKFIMNYTKVHNLKLKIIPVHDRDYFRKGSIDSGVGPFEFVDYIKNSEICFTDSFHCTLFSNMFEKKVVVFDRFDNKKSNSQNSRIHDYLERYGLSNLLYSNSFKIHNINYGEFFKKLSNSKQYSFEYLNSLTKLKSNKTSDMKICSTCSGCGMCAVICPTKAISIKLNDDGFYKYFIDQDKCIKCGQCTRTCGFNNLDNLREIKEGYLFRAKSLDINTLQNSSSGGIGYEIAHHFNSIGYSIIGCEYNKFQSRAKHIIIKPYDEESLIKITKSKYIQSDTLIFKHILEQDKCVIFGLPCQIASIRNFLVAKKLKGDFILVELICHGVPSYHLYNKYCDENNIKNNMVDFRYKEIGKSWRNKKIAIYGDDLKSVIKSNKSEFYTFFELGKCLCESCYECNFRKYSNADLRIGDDWSDKLQINNDGISMVIVMSSTGYEIINKLKQNSSIQIKELDNSVYFNFQKVDNTPKPSNYNQIIDDIKNDNLSLKDIIYKDFKSDYIMSKLLNKYIIFKKGLKR